MKWWMILPLVEKVIKEKTDKRACQASHEEICNQALRHYEKLAKEYSCWNSLIPKAIEYYKKEWDVKDK